jgi:electron transfer flavoprotein alpha/beta subunit
MKRTFDTEEKISLDGGEIIEDGAEFIINPYDEYAIEEAISLKEKHGGEVTVVIKQCSLIQKMKWKAKMNIPHPLF